MIVMTTPRNLGQATRWRVAEVFPIDKQSYAIVEVQLFTTGMMLISEMKLEIRNGVSEGVAIDTSPTELPRALVKVPAIITPTGYDDARAAWRTGSTPAASRAALETWMLQANVAAANMAGSPPP